ncbi:MAG: hypothetical protein FJZ00_03880 [Candidatus Sericytochromatia bacterium]|uniref:DUF4234 domain-containing protein n=1 Tax=Candidatus Tanganyikabacteria bacterium TaxID=2961651 RepID=A0A938BKI7_9BACT|nr:hypothetical protein [Candidatus Tanganyikabacteria bacterium]
MYRPVAVAIAAAIALSGCAELQAMLPWEPGEPVGDLAPGPAPSATPAPLPGEDYANDPHLAWARFGFILVAAGGLAGIVALQARMQKDKPTYDQKMEDIGWPIAAFGFGSGLPVYIYNTVMAERMLETKERKSLTP